MYSDDFFKTKKFAAHKGNRFMVTKNYIYIAQVVDQESQEVVLLGGSSLDKEYNLTPIETNQKKFSEHSYTFLDSSEGSVFLHINHFGEVSRYGHIYISDFPGLHFSLSLKYNVRSYDNQCDFEKVNSLEGVYIANVISSSYMRNAEQEMEEEELNEKNEMSQDSKSDSNSKSHSSDFKNFIKTMITYNKGGNWHRLKAPQRNYNGKNIDCNEHCFLNLQGVSSDYPQFYSVASAAGLIIANANIGKYLSNDLTDIDTYLSRDGGVNWFQIRNGPHIYEIGDHGALIIIADNINPTNLIQYSWDEGMSFQDLQISEEKIMIKNIIIEPTSTSQNFVVYGESTSNKGVKKGVAVGINFSGLHEPQCRNPENPDSADSDYEKWTPTLLNGKECLLGKKVTFIRRKREAQCYNGLTYERKIEVENCQCSEDDYECDVGFERAAPGEPCTNHQNENANPLVPFEIHVPPADCKGVYTISKGYRKIPGNSCVNGVKFDPIVIPCPYTGIFASVGFIFFFIIIIVLVALIAIAFNRNFFQNVSEIMNTKLKNSGSNDKKPDYINIGSNDEDNVLFDDHDIETPEIDNKVLTNIKKKKEDEMKYVSS